MHDRLRESNSVNCEIFFKGVFYRWDYESHANHLPLSGLDTGGCTTKLLDPMSSTAGRVPLKL